MGLVEDGRTLASPQTRIDFARVLDEIDAAAVQRQVEIDVVGLPVYSWGCAIGHAVRMAARITGRSRVLVPSVMDPERMAVLRTYEDRFIKSVLLPALVLPRGLPRLRAIVRSPHGSRPRNFHRPRRRAAAVRAGA